MTELIGAGSIKAKRGERAFGFLPIATGGDGGAIGIGLHVIAGRAPGPKVVVMSTQHGYEICQISVVQRLLAEIHPKDLTGDLFLIPVANPVAFEMGARNNWMDGLWGDSGNMNRLWPGRKDGWLTERFCYAISSDVFPEAAVVFDLHASTSVNLAVGYSYLGPGGPGNLAYDLSLVFGTEIVVYQSPVELTEKRKSGTAKSYLETVGVPAITTELGDYYLLEPDPADPIGTRTAEDMGFVGITNVMKHLGMLEGDPVLPRSQIRVEPELNIRPSHGGLVVSDLGIPDIGRVFPKGTRLGTLYSPYSLEPLEEYTAPFDETLLLGTLYQRPYCRVLPGEFIYILADNALTQVLR